MRKILFIIFMALASIGAQTSIVTAAAMQNSTEGLPLFPFFVDVAGDYNEGIPEEVAALNIPGGYYKTPFFYSSLKDAEDFLQDVLPFSNYIISREETIKEDGTRIVQYASPLTDGRESILTLVEIPSKNVFYAVYAEVKKGDDKETK
ncbi:MAG: hypothetical protein K2J82_09865 [Muribaculaceae bacterium]|nr:hypothetical protein [Muribaculaceae bacterium]